MSDIDFDPITDRFIALMIRLRQHMPEKAPPLAAGISPTQVAILAHVAESPGCGVKEIARALGLSAPSISVSVRQLEAKELLSRQPHPRDRRAVQLFLTPEGQALHEQTTAFQREFFARLLKGLDAQEQAQLVSLLEKALGSTQAS